MYILFVHFCFYSRIRTRTFLNRAALRQFLLQSLLGGRLTLGGIIRHVFHHVAHERAKHRKRLLEQILLLEAAVGHLVLELAPDLADDVADEVVAALTGISHGLEHVVDGLDVVGHLGHVELRDDLFGDRPDHGVFERRMVEFTARVIFYRSTIRLDQLDEPRLDRVLELVDGLARLVDGLGVPDQSQDSKEEIGVY